MKQISAQTKLMKLWDNDYKYFLNQVEQDYGKFSYERESCGDSYIFVESDYSNPEELKGRAWDMMKDYFYDFVETYEDEICDAMFDDSKFLDDDIQEMRELFISNLRFDKFKKDMENNCE